VCEDSLIRYSSSRVSIERNSDAQCLHSPTLQDTASAFPGRCCAKMTTRTRVPLPARSLPWRRLFKDLGYNSQAKCPVLIASNDGCHVVAGDDYSRSSRTAKDMLCYTNPRVLRSCPRALDRCCASMQSVVTNCQEVSPQGDVQGFLLLQGCTFPSSVWRVPTCDDVT
jgi:hypothetical protein